jgi:exopolyphosphatase/guanosine-5'-triphosphate,3'-diphosphate pyrophosphatase
LRLTNLTYGVIDVGSNSVRLLISENGQTINKFAIITRLSKGLTKDGVLSEDSIKRTIDALSFLKQKAIKEFKVDKLFAFATAGVRYAKNKIDFLNVCKSELDLDIDVVSGEIEAEIGALGALNGIDGGFIDVGGKSTEIAQIKANKRSYANSINLGVVTLYEKFLENTEYIKHYCKLVLENNIDKTKIDCKNFVIVGGTATTIASIALSLKEYDFRLVDGYFLDKKTLLKIIDNLIATPVSERSIKYCIQKGREDVIVPGAILILEIINYLSVDGLTVRDSDNLEGYLIKKVGNYE